MSGKRLNDTYVPDDMHREVAAVKRGGGRVFLVISDDRAMRPGHCRNCNGTGAVGMQYFTGGPYEHVPNIQNKPGKDRSGRDKDVPARATYHDGKWFKQKTRTWVCPSCSGTGVT